MQPHYLALCRALMRGREGGRERQREGFTRTFLVSEKIAAPDVKETLLDHRKAYLPTHCCYGQKHPRPGDHVAPEPHP